MKKSFNPIRTVSIGIMLTLWGLLMTAGSVAHAQDITLTLPDTSGIAGDTLRVPLRVSPLQASDAVTSGEFHFSYDAGIVDLVGYETLNTLLEGQGSVLLNQRGNQLAFAGTDTVTGSGTLITLNFLINPSAVYNDRSDLDFRSARLNEGMPATTSADGNIRVQGIRISPRSSNTQVIEGDSLQFSLSGDIHPPVAWEVSDTSRASISADGWLKGKKPGLIRVKATDNAGLADSTERFRVQAATLSSLALTIPDRSARQTLEVEVPVQVSDVTGLNITSSEATISYDARYLEYLSIDNTGTMTEPWGNLTINSNIAGQLNVAGAGTDTLAGAGTLFTMRFRVKDQNTGNSTIAIEESIFNETINATNYNGTFSALAAPAIEINYSDTTLSIGDQLAFSVTGGEGTPPYTWSSSEPATASIDADNGELDALSRGDALITATDAEGFPSRRINVRVNDFDAYLDTVAVSHPDTAAVTLQAGDFSGMGVLSYEMTLQYDTTIVRFLDAETAGTQSEPLSVQIRAHEDTLELAAAGTIAFSGDSPIVKLHFALRDDVITDGEFARLDLLQLQFNEPGPNTPTATLFAGGIQVGDTQENAAPVVVSPIGDVSLDEDHGPYLLAGDLNTVFRDTVDGDPLTFSASVTGQGLAVRISNDSLLVEPEPDYFGEDTLSITATDGLLSVTSEVIVTINPINDPPEFTALPDTVFFAVDSSATLPIYAHLSDVESELELINLEFTSDQGDISFAYDSLSGHLQITSAGYTGLARLRLTATDEDGAVARDSLWLDVQPVTVINPGPVLITAIDDITLDEDSGPYVVAGDLNEIFRDTVDHNPLSFSASLAGSGITVSIANDSLVIEPEPNYFGVDTLTLSATDGVLSNSTEIKITVDPVNDLPEFTALPDTVWFAVDSSATLPLFNHLSDIETDPELMALTFTSDQGDVTADYDSLSGTLQITSAGYIGQAWLSLTATDQDGGVARDTLWLDITFPVAINRGPELPVRVELRQNYPNPFNPATTIRYAVPEEGRVRLEVFNLNGSRVAVLADERQATGYYTVRFEAADLSSGIYFYRLKAGRTEIIRKMTLIK